MADLCPACGMYDASKSTGLCSRCKIKHDIAKLRDEISDLAFILPMHARAKIRRDSITYTPHKSADANKRELVDLYRERDALRKKRNAYREAAVRAGLIRS